MKFRPFSRDSMQLNRLTPYPGHLPVEGRGRGARVRAAFTLAEVLAALAFMAIVIPVAVNGLRVANRAGQVGERKAVAARIADRVLNEWSTTGASQTPAQSGVVRDGAAQYR